MVFGFSPEYCSASLRKSVRLRRNPQEGLFCVHCLIMLFAETICNAFEEPETPLTSDAGQQRVSSVPRSVRTLGKSERKEK
jgi:hypothetical protein